MAGNIGELLKKFVIKKRSHFMESETKNKIKAFEFAIIRLDKQTAIADNKAGLLLAFSVI
jgi:hypothetical protein